LPKLLFPYLNAAPHSSQDLQVALSLQEEETPDERSVAPALSSGPDRSVEETE